jgi:LPPG:FO 2-phospho-L-lactate transferase
VLSVVELAGGVGGAKLADGLQAELGSQLTVVVNTGDDLVLHGLAIWPDHDTVAYTLAGLDDVERGWGIANETWTVMDALADLGDETWFRLGDRDLATHLWRTDRVRAGIRPTDVARELAVRLGVAATILPMTDDPVRTEVRTDEGWLEFQEYFVHRHQAPEIHEVRLVGSDRASATPEVLAALEAADLVVVAPSNPIVSVGPILAVGGIDEALVRVRGRGVPIVAVSGIVDGRALKGPADRMLASLGHEPSALGVARLYLDLVDAFVLDVVDEPLRAAIDGLGLATLVTDTIMTDDASRARLAAEVVAFGRSLATVRS